MREPSAILLVSLAEADYRAPLRFARNDNSDLSLRGGLADEAISVFWRLDVRG